MSASEHTAEQHAEKARATVAPDDDLVVPKPGYRHPIVQVLLVSFVCFSCPGMFNALAGLGGGGQIDATTQDNAAVALYSSFAGMAFFGGSVVNKLGPRLSFTLGSGGYALYIGSFLSYNINQNHGFVIGAGAILGLCAGLLWTAQGALMLAYSTEATKGRYIAMFWMIFNMGAVIGAGVALGQNFHQIDENAVPNNIYIVFIVLTACGVLTTLLLADPATVRRADGTRAIVVAQLSWWDELSGVFYGLAHDPLILLLVPYFWASNWFYTWQFNDFNLALFNPRTRALNNLLYWLSQIVGAGLFGLFLDSVRLSRRMRAYLGWAILFAQIMATWGGNWVIQRTYTREMVEDKVNKFHKMDLYDEGFVGRAWLYIWNGISDACWQTYAYWMIGAVSNNSRKLSVLVGIYKGIQSAGAAVGWRLDAQKVSYLAMFGSTWGLLGGGLLFALPMIIMRVRDHTWAEDDLLNGIDAAGHHVEESHSNMYRSSSGGATRRDRDYHLEDTYHRRNYPLDAEVFQQQHHYPLQRSKER